MFYLNTIKPTFNNYNYSGTMTVTSDHGEFKTNDMSPCCINNNIKLNFTCPYTPDNNAPFERLLRTLDILFNAMMVEKDLKEP